MEKVYNKENRYRGGIGKIFRKNTTHLQTSFFDIENQLSERKKKKIRESEEYGFYQLIFKKIDEEKLKSRDALVIGYTNITLERQLHG